MKTKEKIPDFEDIIFEGRNKGRMFLEGFIINSFPYPLQVQRFYLYLL